MTQTLQLKPRRPARGSEPAWEVARLFPNQGDWSEEEYLALNTNRLVEFSDGFIEVPPMPTTSHQAIVFYLCSLLHGFASARGLGTTLLAPLRVRLWRRTFREPDVVFMLARHADRVGEQFWDRADLVMEVVSPDDPSRDLRTKRQEYARARIPEYWIVDPRDAQDQSITVLRLRGDRYVRHGRFTPGSRASSVLLKGFEVDVAAAFAAGRAGRR